MVQLSDVWKQLDEEIANTPMPDEYKNSHLEILCRDCHKVNPQQKLSIDQCLSILQYEVQGSNLIVTNEALLMLFKNIKLPCSFIRKNTTVA